jgi:hypothetical protein
MRQPDKGPGLIVSSDEKETVERSGANLQPLILISRVYVIFVAASGFLFGQMFFGRFDWPSTIAGIVGVLSGASSGRFIGSSRLRSNTVILLCLASIAGVGFDAHQYYEKYDIPGNYYAWFLFGPYCLFLLVLIANAAMMNPAEKSIRKFLTSTETSGQRGGYGLLGLIPGFDKLPTLGKWVVVMAIVIVIGLINERFL